MLVKKVEVYDKDFHHEVMDHLPMIYRGKRTYYVLGIPVYTVIVKMDKR